MNYCGQCGHRLTVRLVEGRERPACLACGAVVYLDPKLAVAAVIHHEGRVLLGQRASEPGRGRWSFPAGFVDRGEPVEAALVREVREETGLEIAIERLLGLYSEAGNPVVLAVYVARITGGQLAPNQELLAAAFFAPDALPDLAFDHDARILADWWATQRP